MEDFIVNYYCNKGYEVNLLNLTYSVVTEDSTVIYKLAFTLIGTGYYPVRIIKTYNVNNHSEEDFQKYIKQELDNRQFEREARATMIKTDDYFDTIQYKFAI